MKSRRSFLKTVGNLVALASMPLGSALAANQRIIVVGGGVAGTRAAAYLKISLPAASIMLFDPALKNSGDNRYYAIQNQYKPVAGDVLREIGIDIVADQVMQVDPAEKKVYLANGRSYAADFLVVAPGADFKWSATAGYVPGMEDAITHAWQHPSNELGLWQQIEAMADGGDVVISVPAAPYQFPQGPYLRASRIADFLKKFKSRSRVLVLDNNDAFPSMHVYLDQWRNKYPQGMVEWLPASSGGVVEHMDFAGKILYAGSTRIRADVLNFIPPQQAGRVARQAGLNFRNDWCQVASGSLESKHYKNVYVVGDANDAEPRNKTAAAAEQQALRCVRAITGQLV